jgi:hypothetical protein
MKKLFIFLFPLLFIAACNNQPSETTTDLVDEEAIELPIILFNDLFLPAQGGFIRGVDFGMDRAAILAIEEKIEKSVVFKDEDDVELVITTDMGRDVMNFGDITYLFEDGELYAIIIETYLISPETSEGVFQHVIDYLNTKYGEGMVAEDGFVDYVTDNLLIAVRNFDIEDSYGMYMTVEFVK